MTVGPARVAAEAKLNLHLRVLARDASGYHSIETLFTRIALADRVRVQPRRSARTLDCRGAELGPIEQNLAYRAAAAYSDAVGWPHGFHIDLEKHIPAGSGLGGGSADAGAVLRALNALSPRPMREEELLALARTLGADVPFLTSTIPFAFAQGRGEEMRALPPLPAREVALIHPGFSVSTRDAYAWLDRRRERTGGGGVPPLPLDSLVSWEALAPHIANDFEAVVAARHPRLTELLATLRESGASIAGLTGSGSVVFAIFPGAAPTDALERAIHHGLILTRTVTRVAAVDLGAESLFRARN